MRSDSLSLIGKKINEVRKSKKLSLKEVGAKADITAGLLSKVENFRAIPSLPVLHRIAEALEVSLSELVGAVTNSGGASYTLVRKNDRERELREDSKELIYEGLISHNLNNLHMRTTLVTVPANIYRKPISTEALEQVFVIKGSVKYGLEDEILILEEGDTLFFDGNIAHSVENIGAEDAVLFKIYLLKMSNNQ